MNEGIKKFKSQIDEVKSNKGLVLKCSLLNILKTCGMGVVAYLSFKSYAHYICKVDNTSA